jgi:hypothetical protein
LSISIKAPLNVTLSRSRNSCSVVAPMCGMFGHFQTHPYTFLTSARPILTPSTLPCWENALVTRIQRPAGSQATGKTSRGVDHAESERLPTVQRRHVLRPRRLRSIYSLPPVRALHTCP